MPYKRCVHISNVALDMRQELRVHRQVQRCDTIATVLLRYAGVVVATIGVQVVIRAIMLEAEDDRIAGTDRAADRVI